MQERREHIRSVALRCEGVAHHTHLLINMLDQQLQCCRAQVIKGGEVLSRGTQRHICAGGDLAMSDRIDADLGDQLCCGRNYGKTARFWITSATRSIRHLVPRP